MFFYVFVFKKIFSTVSFFVFGEPPFFLSEDAFGGGSDPGLMKFTWAHFGGDIDIEKEKEVFFLDNSKDFQRLGQICAVKWKGDLGYGRPHAYIIYIKKANFKHV